MRPMRIKFLAAAVFFLAAGASVARAAKELTIFFIDVEGGQATLIVSPSGQSVLVDTGWRGYDGRDAARIVEAAKKAHVKKIDYVVITHYHRDHVGGVIQLARKMKIGAFVDHGPNREDSKVVREDFADYEKTLAVAERHIVAKPGDEIPVKGLTVEFLTADGEHLTNPAPGGGQPNGYCATAKEREIDPSENARSVGTLFIFGKFRFVDLGDLTWNKELALVCPNNLIGPVDLYLTSHHGLSQSGSPQLVDAIHPRVAIMNDGARKGGSPSAWQIVKDSPGLEDMWQLHFSIEGGKDHNEPDPFIANIDEQCEGKYIKVTALADGSFTVYNSRNKYQKTYPTR